MSDDFFVEGDFEVAKIIQCEKSVYCCKFNPIGDRFAVGLSDGSIKIFMKENFQLIYTLLDNQLSTINLPVTSIKFNNPKSGSNPDHYKILVATYVSGYIKFWHYPSQSCLFTIFDNQLEPLNFDFNINCDKIAVSGYNTYINVYDVATKKLINRLESSSTHSVMDGHMNRVFCVKYNPVETNQLISGGWDDTVHIWDDRAQHSQRHIGGPHICGDAIDIDIKNNHLITGSWRKYSTLQIWDLRTDDIIRDVFEKKENIMAYTCQWLADEYILLGGSDKNSALIYDRGALKSIGGITDLKNGVVCSDNNRIGRMPDIIVGSDKVLYYLRKKSDVSQKLNKKK